MVKIEKIELIMCKILYLHIYIQQGKKAQRFLDRTRYKWEFNLFMRLFICLGVRT